VRGIGKKSKAVRHARAEDLDDRDRATPGQREGQASNVTVATL
jgi:hypothetical protein